MLYAYEKEKSVGPKDREKMCESEKKKKHIQIYGDCVCTWRSFVKECVRVCITINQNAYKPCVYIYYM